MRPSSITPSTLQLLLATCLYYGSSTAAPAHGYEVGQDILQPHKHTRGAVSSEAKECSRIGADVLAEGGNAVDAVVATVFCVGVAAPYHSGIGGGGFMLVRDAKGNYEAIDFREAAPAAAHENMYQGNINGSIRGGLSVGVPGEVAGLWHAHQKYGVLPWKRLLQGAYGYAHDGYYLNADYQRYILSSTKSNNFMLEDPSWAQDYAENGRLKKEGDIISRVRYAKVLQAIGEQGPKAFYEGPIAEALIATIQAHNGTMTLDDLKNYKVKSRPVLKTTHRGYKLYSMGAPTSGAVSLQILNTMEGYGQFGDASESPDHDQDEARAGLWHRFVEAMKFGYGSRGELGDPDYVEHLEEYQAKMVDKETAKHIRSLINPEHVLNITDYDPAHLFTTDGEGTSHIVTADNTGMAVSLTTTVNLLFGSLLACNVTGVVLNNEMNDFSIPGAPNEFGFEPSQANFIRPGKRPLSSVTPVIVERPDGSFFVTVGAAGGSRIISSTTQVLWRILSEPIRIRAAVAEPRVHDQLLPNTLKLENQFPATSVGALERRGHNITLVDPGLSIVEGIMRDESGEFEAAADPRQKNHGDVSI